MSTGIDIKLVLGYYQRMNDEEMISLLNKGVKGLTPEAREIVEGEIKRRNLDPEFLKIVADQQKTYEHIPKEYDANGCPVDEDRRIWLEEAFGYLLTLFGVEETLNRTILVPDSSDFPVFYDGSEASAFKTLKIVATQMEVPAEKILLDFYDEGIMENTEGSPGGLYWGMGEDDKFEISMVRRLLDEPENMVAILAHEVAHIKLLGENRLEENDEPLTDFTTIFFGLGIFNANSAFQTFANYTHYGWSTQGYLTQMEWGYALALFAYFKKEHNPAWINHLSTNVRADFKQSLNYILNNEEKITINFSEIWNR